MKPGTWSRFFSDSKVRTGLRRFVILAIAIPVALIILLKSPLHPTFRLVGAFALIVLFWIVLRRANNSMNSVREQLDADNNRRRVAQGLPPRQRRRWFRRLFPFFT